MKMAEIPVKQEIIRDAKGRFPKGISGNPNGRPKGQSLKEFWRIRLADMEEKQKLQFTKEITKEMIWKMAEGNPHNDIDLNAEVQTKIISADD